VERKETNMASSTTSHELSKQIHAQTEQSQQILEQLSKISEQAEQSRQISKQLSERISNQSKIISELSRSSKEVSEQLSKVEEKLDLFRGSTNERLLREQVAKEYGERFARRFMIRGLSGLVRLVTQKKGVSEFETDYEREVQNPDLRSDTQRQMGVQQKLLDDIKVTIT
jgi:methyl-accepting chemotaxis protein